MSQNVALEMDVNLALALAQGKSIADAAAEAGICRRTVERKLNKPRFRRRVANFRGQLVGVAVGRLADNMARAADNLAALLEHEDAKLRLRASRTLLLMGVKLREAVDVDDRICEIEAELAGKQAAAL